MIKRYLVVLVLCTVVGVCIAVNNGTCGALVYFVSPLGNDSWSGTLFEPNAAKTHGPFATLEQARQAVRDLKKTGDLLWSEITVYLRGGMYPRAQTLVLTAEDSGTKHTPVRWRAYPGETVVFTGGVFVTEFEPVKDAKILKQIDNYRDKIVRTNLAALGITDFGDIDPYKGNKKELYFKKEFMNVARYPNEGWLLIKDVPQTGTLVFEGEPAYIRFGISTGRHYGRVAYDGDRPQRWSNIEDIYLHGYWVWDWSDSYQKITKIDTKRGEFIMKEPHHHYGYAKNQRYYALNILGELDTPGEWYLDGKTGILYFWPPTPVKEGDVLVSVLKDPIVSLDNCSYVALKGIQFEGARGTAVKVTGGTNNTVAGCTFVNIGQVAVAVDGGTDNGVLSCDIYNVGAGGILIEGGHRPSLTPAGNYAVNNHIHHYSQRIRTW